MAPQAILFRVLNIADCAYVLDQGGVVITLPHASCWPTMISRNVTAQCDPEHRLVNHNHERVLTLSRRFSGGGSVIHANRRVIGDAAVCYCQMRLSENDRAEVFGMKNLFAAIVVFVGFTGLAAAQAPVAVVEDVQGKVTGAEFMDYVAPGAVIKLGPGSTVVLGYMKSCWRETITGVGTVIVGSEESMVHLSEVKAGKVQCDSSRSKLVDREVRESAATIVRGIDDSVSATPQVTLYGLSPVVETVGRGKLVVERLDVTGERYDINLTPASVVRGKFYDFAKTKTSLKPGGTYAVSLGSQRTVFLVDSHAESGPTPIIGRLVRLK